MRFLLFGPARLLPDTAGQSEDDAAPAASGAESAAASPPDGRALTPGRLTAIEVIFGSDRAGLARFWRAKDVRGPGSWECDPEAFARYFLSGDWRNPGQVCHRPLVKMGVHWVE